ncbi:MAG TPA: MBL fold metallo-hydrolase [Burkholderiaceae bacterium]|nr:MBL fold metallo-hydrolase [Burkholderiaceae bacterium]
MRFCSLGSGSEGNALLVEYDSGLGLAPTRILLDCGFGLRALTARLAERSLAPSDLHAIFITHEHGDHVSGAYTVARRIAAPLFMSRGTYLSSGGEGEGVEARFIRAGEVQPIGDIEVTPWAVPHDAREPLQYSFSAGGRRLVVLTDLGSITPGVLRMVGGADALVLECNHDETMLRQSDYPPSLKQRILGAWGHLSNTQAAALLAEADTRCLKAVHAAHLSQSNNRPDLARAALATALGADEEEIGILAQHSVGDWIPA